MGGGGCSATTPLSLLFPESKVGAASRRSSWDPRAGQCQGDYSKFILGQLAKANAPEPLGAHLWDQTVAPLLTCQREKTVHSSPNLCED